VVVVPCDLPRQPSDKGLTGGSKAPHRAKFLAVSFVDDGGAAHGTLSGSKNHS